MTVCQYSKTWMDEGCRILDTELWQMGNDISGQIPNAVQANKTHMPNSNRVTWLVSGKSLIQPAWRNISMTPFGTLRRSMSS